MNEQIKENKKGLTSEGLTFLILFTRKLMRDEGKRTVPNPTFLKDYYKASIQAREKLEKEYPEAVL